MTEECLKSQIRGSNTSLKPIVLKAILTIYLRGQFQMSAKEVKAECVFIDKTKDWNRLAAICNAMRNAIKCNGSIIGEDRNNMEFTIKFFK